MDPPGPQMLAFLGWNSPTPGWRCPAQHVIGGPGPQQSCWFGYLLWGGSFMAKCVGEVSVEAQWGAEALGTLSPVVNWERSTCRNVSLSSILALQASDSGSNVTTGSRAPLSPSGCSTWLSDCKSRCTSNWWGWLHVFLLGDPQS